MQSMDIQRYPFIMYIENFTNKKNKQVYNLHIHMYENLLYKVKKVCIMHTYVQMYKRYSGKVFEYVPAHLKSRKNRIKILKKSSNIDILKNLNEKIHSKKQPQSR